MEQKEQPGPHSRPSRIFSDFETVVEAVLRFEATCGIISMEVVMKGGPTLTVTLNGDHLDLLFAERADSARMFERVLRRLASDFAYAPIYDTSAAEAFSSREILGHDGSLLATVAVTETS